MKPTSRIILLLISLIALPACSFGVAETPTPSPLPPAATTTPTKTPTPTTTPTPSTTPTITPTHTLNPTDLVENYMSMLGTYLATAHDAEVEGMEIKGGTLEVRIQSHASGESLLRFTSWQIVQDLAQLLQLLGPNTELLIDIIGSEDYVLDLLVLSEDGLLGYRSQTNRELFIAVQERSINNQEWEELSNGHFEEF